MNPEDFVKTAGLWPQQDEVGLWQWRVSREVQPRIRRFGTFIAEVLAHPTMGTPALAARLIAFDGITPTALQEIEKQRSIPYRTGDDVQIEWEATSPPRTERRTLSKLTAAVWPISEHQPGEEASAASAELSKGMEEFLSTSRVYRMLESQVEELERDAICWWFQALPPPLFSHLSGLQVLSALPRSALARARKKMAVVYPQDVDAEIDSSETDLGLTAEMIDSADAATGSDKNAMILKQGIEFLVTTRNEPDGTSKRRWAQNLHTLKSGAESAGPITSLLLAWCIHLCERGTVFESNPARTTVRKYFVCAAEPLFEVLRMLPEDFDSQEWSAENMRDRYLELMSAQSDGNKKNMANALTNFHAFVVDWFDIEPMGKGLHSGVPVARVQAQIVWQNEVDLLTSWLHNVEDERIQNAATIIIKIAYEAPSRTNELLRLRRANFRQGKDEQGEFMEIEIARSARQPRLKTKAAQRTLSVRDLSTIELIQEWVDRRRREGAAMDALIFGDPNDDGKVYRGAAITSLLNRLLKIVTGERDAHIHWLRHGAVSRKMSPDLSSSALFDMNRHVIAANGAGHVTPVSSFRTYFHTYEWCLRVWLDAALQENIALTSATAASLLGVKPASLRQQAHRKATPIEEFLWWRLREMSIGKASLDVTATFNWCAPELPMLVPHSHSKMTVTTALSIAQQLCTGVTEQSLALRCGVAESAITQMNAKFQNFCLEFARRCWPRLFTLRGKGPASFSDALSLANFDLERAKQHKYQKLEDWFSREQDFNLVRRAIASWLACRVGDYLALDREGQVLDLFQMLMAAKVDPTELRLCISVAAEVDPATTLSAKHCSTQELVARQSARDDFLTIFGVYPRETFPHAHSGLPGAYLQWDSPGHLDQPSSASGSCAGLDAWLAATVVLIFIKGWTHDSA